MESHVLNGEISFFLEKKVHSIEHIEVYQISLVIGLLNAQ